MGLHHEPTAAKATGDWDDTVQIGRLDGGERHRAPVQHEHARRA